MVVGGLLRMRRRKIVLTRWKGSWRLKTRRIV